MTPNEQKAYEWENEFYLLTETMDGQFRPDLKKLITSQIAQARADERRRIGEEIKSMKKQPKLEGEMYNPLDADPACVYGYNTALSDIHSLINKE